MGASGGKVFSVGGQGTRQAKEGDEVPAIAFKVRIKTGEDNSFDWKEIKTTDLFKGKRVVVFGVPGAFTPVCSCDHLPGYERLYEQMRQFGADEVYCISVNDAFVMRHWGLAQGHTEELVDNSNPLNPGNFTRVKLVPDGAAKFTKAMGMTCRWDEKGGFGLRSWRYSAVFNDMRIEKLHMEEEGKIEDDAAHGPEPLLVSDGATMLNYLKSTYKGGETKSNGQ